MAATPDSASAAFSDTVTSLGAALTFEFIDAAEAGATCPSDRWLVDETYVKISGRWHYLYRLIDQHG